MMSLAEKFQLTVPTKTNGGMEWASPESVRVIDNLPKPDHGTKHNIMPPGMDIANQPNITNFVHGFGGDTDVSQHVSAKALNSGMGFTRIKMKGTDDQYSSEHIDLFYGEVEDENGNAGFIERNNMLDRM
jgi:hypothetical protein